MCHVKSKGTAYHLFFTCSFSSACWNKIGIQWHVNLSFYRMLKTAKDMFQNPFLHGIFIIIAAWHIWKQRKALVFVGKHVMTQIWPRRSPRLSSLSTSVQPNSQGPSYKRKSRAHQEGIKQEIQRTERQRKRKRKVFLLRSSEMPSSDFLCNSSHSWFDLYREPRVVTKRPSLNSWVSHFVDETRLQAHRIKESNRQSFLNWVDLV